MNEQAKFLLVQILKIVSSKKVALESVVSLLKFVNLMMVFSICFEWACQDF